MEKESAQGQNDQETQQLEQLENELQNIENKDEAPPQEETKQPQTPQPTQTQVPSQPSGGGMKKILVVAVVLLVISLLALAGYYFGFKSTSTNEQTPSPLSTLVPTPTETPDPTANWKTYIDRDLGFTFNYPQDWEVRDSIPSGSRLELGLAPINIKEDILGSISVNNDGNEFNIDFVKNLLDYVNKLVSEREITLGGLKAKEIILENTLAKVKSRYIIFSKDGWTYRLMGGGTTDTSTIDQILSTFKFMEATPLASPIPKP